MSEPTRPTGAKARIVSQAVIVFTLVEDEHGRTMQVRSFGSPEGPEKGAEEYADAVLQMLRVIDDRRYDIAKAAGAQP